MGRPKMAGQPGEGVVSISPDNAHSRDKKGNLWGKDYGCVAKKGRSLYA